MTAAGPVADRESAPFWDGLAARRIVLQACRACGRHRFPRMPSCPYCGEPGGTDVAVPGTGRVYSWVRVHRLLSAGTTGTTGTASTDGADDGDGADAGELPYAVVTVTLDTGPRMVGRLEPAGRATVDLPVRPLFVDHGGWTELRFRPDEPDEAAP